MRKNGGIPPLKSCLQLIPHAKSLAIKGDKIGGRVKREGERGSERWRKRKRGRKGMSA